MGWIKSRVSARLSALILTLSMVLVGLQFFVAGAAEASFTVFKSCYASGSTTFRARMWNYWDEYGSPPGAGGQRPSRNTVIFEKWVNGAWQTNNWATSANADFRRGSTILQRRGPLDPPSTWEFTYTSGESGDNVRLRASGSGQSLDCTAWAL